MWFFESFQKVCPKSSVLRWEAFEELIRSPKKCTADTGARRICTCFWGSLSALLSTIQISCFWLLAAVGMIFLKKKGLLISPLGYIKWGPLSSHQDIYIYSYYLGQVWPFEGLLSGPSLFFNTVCKKHYKNRGFSTFCFEKKSVHKNLKGYHLGQVGHFYVATNLAQIITLTWPR